MEYGITWVLFDMPQYFVDYVFIPFTNLIATPFSEVFPWFPELWDQLYGKGRDILEFFDKFVDVDWIIDFLYDQSNFFANIGDIPMFAVVIAYIIYLGIGVTIFYYALDVLRKLNPLVGN